MTKVQKFKLHPHTAEYIEQKFYFFGIKSTLCKFYTFIDKFIQDIKRVSAYFDNLIIEGKTIKKCRDRLVKTFEKLRKYLNLNSNEYNFF